MKTKDYNEGIEKYLNKCREYRKQGILITGVQYGSYKWLFYAQDAKGNSYHAYSASRSGVDVLRALMQVCIRNTFPQEAGRNDAFMSLTFALEEKRKLQKRRERRRNNGKPVNLNVTK